MTLRDRLAAKARRTLTVPVLVDDPSSAQDRAEAAQLALGAHRAPTDGEDTVGAALLAELNDAVAALTACAVQVPFAALDPTDFEALLLHHTNDAGDVDRVTFLAALAAESVVDIDLRDESWWTAALSKGGWSKGERDALYAALLNLNVSAPRGRLGKG